MPMHDWTRVSAGVFHDFHHEWISTIRNALNGGLLPADYYAMAEQVAEGPIADVLALEQIVGAAAAARDWTPETGRSAPAVAVDEHPPHVRYTLEAEQELYLTRTSPLAIYHTSGDRVVAFVEIVSPGNKQSEVNTRKFLDKCAAILEKNCHLLVMDPHPPTKHASRGLHARFWSDYFGRPETPGVSAEQSLALMAYRSDVVPTAYFQPLGVGEALIDMPLFLDRNHYINVPLERTYMAAYEATPHRWRRVIEADHVEDRPALNSES